jgi:hypothetical protein
MDSSDEHSSNADSPRIRTRLPDPKVSFERLPQDLKQDLAIDSTDEGIQIDSSDEHLSNADSSRVESRESDSNFKSESLPQYLKQELEIASTDEGTQMDSRDEQLANAPSPRFDTLQPASNSTDTTKSLQEKHPIQSVSIFLGIVICLSSPK